MAAPTPQQRADYLIRKLENFIREGRAERGMSFKSWQALARAELTNTFTDMEKRHADARRDLTVRRMVLVSAATLVTAGFWGAVLAAGNSYGAIPALVLFSCGVVLLIVASEMGMRKVMNKIKVERRQKSFDKIACYDKQLKALEDEIWKKLEKTKKLAELELRGLE